MGEIKFVEACGLTRLSMRIVILSLMAIVISRALALTHLSKNEFFIFDFIEI